MTDDRQHAAPPHVDGSGADERVVRPIIPRRPSSGPSRPSSFAPTSFTPPMLYVPKADLAAYIGGLDGDAAERAFELTRRFDCSEWSHRCRHYELRESFYVLDLLDRVLPEDLRMWAADGRCLDVGARHWPYLAAQRTAVLAAWDGVELEGRRRYRSLQTRQSVARWRMRGMDDCGYHTGSVTELAGPYRLVTWFLPFVTLTPLVLWGLSEVAFEPASLLEHVWSIIEPGGVLLVTNQDAEEAAEQGRLFDRLGIDAEHIGPLPSPLSPFVHVREGWFARRPS